MSGFNLTDWMLDEKIARHWKQAHNIIAGLQLDQLYNTGEYEQCKSRARLYRDWRNAGEEPKIAYAKAIAGEKVPAPMFEEVLHAHE
jgi:hypothetical protein